MLWLSSILCSILVFNIQHSFIDVPKLLKSTSFRETSPQIVNKCSKLLHHGQWGPDFKLNGFERKISQNLTIINPWDDRYPFDPWPPYKRWPYQNYTGTWTSGEENSKEACTIKQVFTRQDLSKCFKNQTTILYMGDSRTRQLYTSLKMMFQNETVFKDVIGTASDETYLDGIVKLKFIRSKTFWYLAGASSYEYNILKGLEQTLDIAVAEDRKLVVIIGEQIVWPMKSYFEHYIPWNRLFKNMTDKREFGDSYKRLAKDWVRYFCIAKLENQVMPKVLELLKTHKDRLRITFMRTTARLNNRERLYLYRELLREYNSQMDDFIGRVKLRDRAKVKSLIIDSTNESCGGIVDKYGLNSGNSSV